MKYRIVYSPLPYKTKFSYYVCPLCEKLIGENWICLSCGIHYKHAPKKIIKMLEKIGK